MEHTLMLVNGGLKEITTDCTVTFLLCGMPTTGLCGHKEQGWNVMTSIVECLLAISGKFMFVKNLVQVLKYCSAILILKFVCLLLVMLLYSGHD